MTFDPPTEVTQNTCEDIPSPSESITTLATSSSVEYSSSMDCDTSTRCEPTMPVGYQLKKLVPRAYQQELAKPGIEGKNCIIVAPTGSGKTLVAAIIITEHLKKLQASDDVDDVAKVVFLVHTKPLADQQCKVLQEYIEGARVECIVGDSIGTIRDALTENDIVVCTTGKYLDELDRDMVTLVSRSHTHTESEKSRITLLVMDECHHARKASAQAKVMHHYITHKHKDPSALFPQVVGLTASPGAGDNQNLDTTKTIDHLVNLCALLDATSGIVTVKENMSSLEQVVKNPELNRELVTKRRESEGYIRLIEEQMEKLEAYALLKSNSFPKSSQQYETNLYQKKQPLELSTNEKFRDQISTLNLLICYSRALNIYMDLRQEDSLKVLHDFNDLPDRDITLTEHEQKLKLSLNALKSKLEVLSPVENPLLLKAKEVINAQFQKDPKSLGVFFVHTKRHAFAVCKWLQSFNDISKPIVITGHSRDNGMTQADQEDAMEKFRNGDCNILVATSVAEEGLDVPACNFVIRFQHVTNEIASTQTQGRARAEESEVSLILSSDSAMNMKEIQNSERLELVNKIVECDWIPSGKNLVEKLRKRQDAIIRNIEITKFFKEHLKRPSGEGKKFKLRCKKCKEVACSGSDIFTIEDTSHHVVPGDGIRNKLVKKPHHKPGQIYASIIKTHKIYCENCDADWGVMCTWPVEGYEFPILKCAKFLFEMESGHPMSISQWSKAPFEVFPLEVWIAEQNDTDSDKYQ